MASEIPLECSCGTVTGVILEAEDVFRILCHCQSCQAYARYLGRKEEMLDSGGGTSVYQLTPAQIRITQGAEQIRCVRLSAKGALRWYAGCCRTPMGNTLESPWVPWVGIPHPFVDHGPEGLTNDTAFGPIRYRINARHAAARVEEAHRYGPASLIVSSLLRTVSDLAQGRNRPSPFFDDETRKPVMTPVVLTGDERVALGLDRTP
jgi:hypothetical protein